VVRDLPIFEAQTWLIVPRFRLACRRCGPKLEALPWLAPYARVTRRLAESVARLCAVLAIKHVAEFYGLGWDAVKAIDKAYLLETLGPVELSGVEVIAMDEFALHRGRRYATVVVEPYRKRVLWVGRGRGQEDLRPFFELLGEEGCRRLKAAVMDLWDPYAAAVRRWCPNAEVVYDLFHVLALYAREVIDRVRIDEANRLRRDRAARRVIKGARWLLLKRRENLQGPQERVRLRELLEANEALMTAYLLKEDLKRLWRYRYPGAALRFFREWTERALESGIPPLIRFARKLQRHLHGIIAHSRWPLHTSLLEGMSNKIKVIKRMAYGFRDHEYFFLKIRAAFPGNPG
jgi:transposase